MPMPQQQQLAFSVPQCLPALLPVNQQGRICPSLVCLLWEYAAGEQLVQHGSVQYVQQGVEAAAAQLTTSLSYRARSFVVVVGLFALVPCFVVRSLRFLSRGNKAAFCFKQPGGGSFECLDETTNISTYLYQVHLSTRYFCQVNPQYSSSTFQYFYTTLEWFSIHK